MYLSLEIKNDKLVSSVKNIVSGGKNYYILRATFNSNDWEGLSKFAVFPDYNYSIAFDGSNEAVLDEYITQNSGILTFGILGIDSNGNLKISTNRIHLRVGCGVSEVDSSPPTPLDDATWETYIGEIAQSAIDEQISLIQDKGLSQLSKIQSESDTVIQSIQSEAQIQMESISTAVYEKLHSTNVAMLASPDISYEIVNGIKCGYFGEFKDDENCFTVYIKIPDKKFACIYTTAVNATDDPNNDGSSYLGSILICDKDKSKISTGGGRTAGDYTCLNSSRITGIEGAVYVALSYVNGTKFDVKLHAVDAVNESYLPITETDLPDDFIVNADNLVTGLSNVFYATSSNQNTWIYSANAVTELFEIQNGKTYYHNGNYVYVYLFDENYTYLESVSNYTSGDVLECSDTAKYAFIAINGSNMAVTEDFWFSEVDLSTAEYKPNVKINPKYVGVVSSENTIDVDAIMQDIAAAQETADNAQADVEALRAGLESEDFVKQTGKQFEKLGNIPVASGSNTIKDSDINIDDVEKIENKDQPNGYAGLDEDGMIKKEQLPESVSKDSILPIVTPDISYEIVNGKKVNFYGSALLDDEDCFTVYIKIPEKKFAYIKATKTNTVHTINQTDYTSGTLLCAGDKSIIKNGGGNTAVIYTVFPYSVAFNVEGAEYFAISYTNNTDFEIKVNGVGCINESYLPIAETDLPDDFIVNADNLVSEIDDVWWSVGANRWSFSSTSPSTNFFKVTNGDVFYHNGNFIYLHLFDENYTYIGSSNALNSGITAVEKENVKYAYAYSTVAGNINESLWISRADLSRKKYKPNRIVNPAYVDLYDIDRNQIKNWYCGKRVSFLGDSLTQNGSGGIYINYLKEFFGFANVTKCGKGGTLVSGETVPMGDPFWYDSRVNAVDIDSDIIFIAGGTNDANNNVTLGSNDISNCDTNTFYGAYNVLLSKLIYKFYKLESGYYPDIDYSGVTQVEEAKPVQIFLITPPYMLNSETSYNKISVFAEAVVNVGKLLGFPVCDTRANSGVNMFTAEYYRRVYDDGSFSYIHLNGEAHKAWAKVIIGKMLEIEPIE